MPVKSLESFFFERNAARLIPVSIFQDARLGIDVNHYINRLASSKKEPFLTATGGFPASLKFHIESDLRVFKEYNITPIFVFSGNSIADVIQKNNSKNITPSERQRNLAWSKYAELVKHSSDQLPFPLESFREYHTPLLIDVLFKALVDYFIEKDLQYVRAPYFSWVQLGYMLQEDLIDAVYGPTETILLPSIDKFVLGMEYLAQPEFRFVDKARFLSELNITQEQLVSISVSVGCDLQPITMPFYPQAPYQLNHLFSTGLEIATAGGGIYPAVLALENEELTAKFQRGVMALHFTPVLKTGGRVELAQFNGNDDPALSNPETCPPTDLHDIIGQRLPHEYLYYQSLGLVDIKVLESIVSGTYFESPPMETTITSQYKSSVKSSLVMKTKAINLMTQNMARFYQVKRIKFVKNFDSLDVDLTTKGSSQLYFQLKDLVVRGEGEFTIGEFLQSLGEDVISKKNAFKLEEDSDKLSSNKEIIGTSLLRELYLLEFFDFDQEKKKIKSNKWTTALYALKGLDPLFQEQHLLLLIFLKLNPFDLTEELSANLVGSVKTKEPSERKIIHLLTRLATFIAPEQHQHNYAGPLSRALLTFRTCVDVTKISTSELFEAVMLNSLANGEVNNLAKSIDDWRSLVKESPFRKITPPTILGVVVQTILEKYYAGDKTKESLKGPIDTSLKLFGHEKSSLVNLERDLKAVFKFAIEANTIIKLLKSQGFLSDDLSHAASSASELSRVILNL